MPTSSTTPASPSSFLHLVVGTAADALLRVKLFDEIIDRHLVLRRLFRRAAGLDGGNGFRLDAGLLGHRRVHRPFVLRLPLLRGAQNGEFRQPRRHAGLEAQMPAELLREFPEGRRMQKDGERARHLELAARARGDGLRQRALVGGQGALIELGQAGRLHVGHGCFLLRQRTDVAVHGDCSVRLSGQLAGSIEI